MKKRTYRAAAFSMPSAASLFRPGTMAYTNPMFCIPLKFQAPWMKSERHKISAVAPLDNLTVVKSVAYMLAERQLGNRAGGAWGLGFELLTGFS